MKTLCGLSGYKTLPNKYKNSAYSSPREIHKSEETPSKPLNILPPRPGIARSFSFSGAKTSNNTARRAKCDVSDEKIISRSGSVNMNMNMPEPNQSANMQPLSRSLSLASLQHGHVPLPGHVAPPSGQDNHTGHAGIWARGRRASSCRNLRDINQDCTEYSKIAE